MVENLTELFCAVDDFWQEMEPKWHEQLLAGHCRRRRKGRMCMSEMMTIVILFHQIGYRNFKNFYVNYLSIHFSKAFPHLLSYNRFVELMPRILIPLCSFVHRQSKRPTGYYFIDSTTIKVCHSQRASSHRVFQSLARKSESTMGWYFGFKLHLVINDRGEIMAFCLSKATTDDRKPVDQLTQRLTGCLVGDKGYISRLLTEQLFERGLRLITKIRKNMDNKLIGLQEKLLLRKRVLIETVHDQLKNISQIEHTRHRSPWNFLINMLSGLAAYCLQPKKPSLRQRCFLTMA